MSEVKKRSIFAAISNALWRKRLWLGIVGVLLLAVTIVVHNLGEPSIGVIQSTGDAPAPVEAKQPPKTFSDKYVEFQYPADFVAAAENPNGPPAGLLDYRMISASTHGSRQSAQLALSIKHLPDGGLQDDSNYRHYIAAVDDFDKQTVPYGSDQVTIFRAKADAYSAIVFWPHGKLLAVLALTSSLGDASELDQTLSQVLRSFAWQ